MQNGRWNSQLVTPGITLLVFVAGCFAIVFASQSKMTEETQRLRNTSFEVGNHSNDDSSSDDVKLENIPTDFGKPHSLPLPSTMSVPKYEQLLFDFLNNRVYMDELNWLKDKGVRDTGPYLRASTTEPIPPFEYFIRPA